MKNGQKTLACGDPSKHPLPDDERFWPKSDRTPYRKFFKKSPKVVKKHTFLLSEKNVIFGLNLTIFWLFLSFLQVKYLFFFAFLKISL